MVRLSDRPDMTLDVYRGRKTTIQQQQQLSVLGHRTYLGNNRTRAYCTCSRCGLVGPFSLPFLSFLSLSLEDGSL